MLHITCPQLRITGKKSSISVNVLSLYAVFPSIPENFTELFNVLRHAGHWHLLLLPSSCWNLTSINVFKLRKSRWAPFAIKVSLALLIYLTGWGVLVAKHIVCVEMGLISSFNCFSASGVKDGYSIHRSVINHNGPYMLSSLSLSLLTSQKLDNLGADARAFSSARRLDALSNSLSAASFTASSVNSNLRLVPADGVVLPDPLSRYTNDKKT